MAQPTTIAGLGNSLDALTKRVDLLAREIKYTSARERLAPELAGLLAGYSVSLPPVDESTGLIDEKELSAALRAPPAGHPHAMPAEQQARLRRVLADMGRLP